MMLPQYLQYRRRVIIVYLNSFFLSSDISGWRNGGSCQLVRGVFQSHTPLLSSLLRPTGGRKTQCLLLTLKIFLANFFWCQLELFFVVDFLTELTHVMETSVYIIYQLVFLKKMDVKTIMLEIVYSDLWYDRLYFLW